MAEYARTFGISNLHQELKYSHVSSFHFIISCHFGISLFISLYDLLESNPERPIFPMSFLPAAGLSNDLTPYLRLVEEARNSLVEFRVRDVTSASPLISTGDPSIDTFSSPNANLGCLSPDAFRQAFGHLSFQDRQG